ncbi:hypothetical protein HLB23_25765 [Nocardia uniformis]|uniref:Uncharacterized protein n=1 Tax=Nocardia uniformis TaxID=53432 RepID=A0A849C3B6_9NOCA|nr:hypothetical protein [Nocardia uniformis]NNH73223.1 hypothetical protein [Nocardia uniformis]
MASRTCYYCSHHNTGADARCAHCGAPLSGQAEATEAAPTAERPAPTAEVPAPHRMRPADMAKDLSGAVTRELAAPLGRIRTLTDRRYPRRHWVAVAAGIAGLLVCGMLVGSRFAMTPPTAAAGVATASLPEPLRAASCQRYKAAEPSERCVLAAGDALLSGISGRRDLIFHVRAVAPTELAETVAQWRGSARAIVADGEIFAAIGPAATVLYADSAKGIRLETTAFEAESSARSFLNRSGLLR